MFNEPERKHPRSSARINELLERVHALSVSDEFGQAHKTAEELIDFADRKLAKTSRLWHLIYKHSLVAALNARFYTTAAERGRQYLDWLAHRPARPSERIAIQTDLYQLVTQALIADSDLVSAKALCLEALSIANQTNLSGPKTLLQARILKAQTHAYLGFLMEESDPASQSLKAQHYLSAFELLDKFADELPAKRVILETQIGLLTGHARMADAYPFLLRLRDQLKRTVLPRIALMDTQEFSIPTLHAFIGKDLEKFMLISQTIFNCLRAEGRFVDSVKEQVALLRDLRQLKILPSEPHDNLRIRLATDLAAAGYSTRALEYLVKRANIMAGRKLDIYRSLEFRFAAIDQLYNNTQFGELQKQVALAAESLRKLTAQDQYLAGVLDDNLDEFKARLINIARRNSSKIRSRPDGTTIIKVDSSPSKSLETIRYLAQYLIWEVALEAMQGGDHESLNHQKLKELNILNDEYGESIDYSNEVTNKTLELSEQIFLGTATTVPVQAIKLLLDGAFEILGDESNQFDSNADARLDTDLSQHSKALAFLDRASNKLRENSPKISERTKALFSLQLGLGYFQIEYFEQAQAYLESCVTHYEQALLPGHLRIIKALELLTICYEKQHLYALSASSDYRLEHKKTWRREHGWDLPDSNE